MELQKSKLIWGHFEIFKTTSTSVTEKQLATLATSVAEALKAIDGNYRLKYFMKQKAKCKTSYKQANSRKDDRKGQGNRHR